jgi:endonuclease/exonuclease/phosphatase family metal-dependent hydrolase
LIINILSSWAKITPTYKTAQECISIILWQFFIFQPMIRLFKRLNIWLIIFTLLSYITPFVSPDDMSFLIFMGLAYPWFLLFNLIFIMMWALSRMPYWWYSAVCILLGYYYLTSVFGFNFFPKKPTGISLKIMTYNVGAAPSNYLTKFNDFIKNENADVICFQEFGGDMNHFKNLKESVINLNKYTHFARLAANNTAIFSKYPILQQGFVPFENPNGANGCSFSDIQVNTTKTIRAYSVHLQSNEVSGLADYLSEKAEFNRKSTWSKAFTMLKLVRRTSKKRAKQAEAISKHTASSPYPVILCGDFNDIPVSYTYRTMANNLKDAFRLGGKGFSSTYNGNIPALKIDNILVDKRISVFDCTIGKVRYSDHYPMTSTIGLNY